MNNNLKNECSNMATNKIVIDEMGLLKNSPELTNRGPGIRWYT